MIRSLAKTAIKGKKNDLVLSLISIPEKSEIAITGEKPDQPSFGPKANLHKVVTAISTSVNINSLLFVLILLLFVASKNSRKMRLQKPIFTHVVNKPNQLWP